MKKYYFSAIILFFIANVNAQVFYEGFDGETFPPEGWEIETTNTTYTWELYSYGGFDSTPNAAQVWFHETENQDEGLISPSIDLSSYASAKLVFGSTTFFNYTVSPNDNVDLFCLVSVDGGESWTKIWDENELAENEGGSFEPIPYVIEEDLSEFIGNSDVKFKFHYVGVNGAQWIIDEIKLYADSGFEDVIESTDNFLVYPNPIKDFINIRLHENTNIDDVAVTIMNISGKRMASFKGTNRLNISNLPSGIYIVSINDGVRIRTERLIKE